MYPPRRMFRGPQEEHRQVSTETEVKIPNLEALSICAFSALTATGFLWWSRFWKIWFCPLLCGLGIFLIMFKNQVTLQKLGLEFHDHLLKKSKGRIRRAIWKRLQWFMNSIVLPTMNRITPPVAVAIASFFGTYAALSYWYNEVAWWADVLLGISAGFAIGTCAVCYYHWNNVRNPAWPPPYWYIEGESDENETFLIGDRSGYARREEDW